MGTQICGLWGNGGVCHAIPAPSSSVMLRMVHFLLSSIIREEQPMSQVSSRNRAVSHGGCGCTLGRAAGTAQQPQNHLLITKTAEQTVGTSAHPGLWCTEIRAPWEGRPQDPHPTQHCPALQCMGSSDGVGMPQRTGSAPALSVPHVSTSCSVRLRQRVCQALATHSAGHSAQRAPCCPQAVVRTGGQTGGKGEMETVRPQHWHTQVAHPKASEGTQIHTVKGQQLPLPYKPSPLPAECVLLYSPCFLLSSQCLTSNNNNNPSSS